MNVLPCFVSWTDTSSPVANRKPFPCAGEVVFFFFAFRFGDVDFSLTGDATPRTCDRLLYTEFFFRAASWVVVTM